MTIKEKKKRKEQAIALLERAFDLLDSMRETQAEAEDIYQTIKSIKENESYHSTLNYLIKKYQ